MELVGSSGSGKSKMAESLIRQLLRSGTGITVIDPHGTLYHAIVAYCAHHVIDREVILVDLSSPEAIIPFDFFKRQRGDTSVQVDRRISSTLHAWGARNADETPTLARVLRLVFTVMIELGLPLPQVRHLLDFNARVIRGNLIEGLQSELVQKEWRELQEMRSREWRDETLSARNRLFKFLTSETLCRVLGVPSRGLDLASVMDDRKVLLVNLAQSDHLSSDNARAFGALLLNELFEIALRRGDGAPAHYIFLDEFQTFVSIDVADMLDQIRKRSVFLTLLHQRFGQLSDKNITDAVLTNCRVKCVFGGLPVESARLMAEELFIGELDAKKIKAAVYQTKFWPTYSRDKVYTTTTGHSSSSGGSAASALSSGAVSTAGEFFGPAEWLGTPLAAGTSSGRSETESSVSTTGSSWSEADAYSESVADIPIFIPVPFQELSSTQYYTHEEQLTELTAALKEQFPRHCFIKIHEEKTQPLLVPLIRDVATFRTSPENLDWYRAFQLKRQGALSPAEADRLISIKEADLILGESAEDESAEMSARIIVPAEVIRPPQQTPKLPEPIWPAAHAATGPEAPAPIVVEAPQPRKRGPKPDKHNHELIASVIRSFGDNWTSDEKLEELCAELDRLSVPVPKTWANRNDGKCRSWNRALEHYPRLIIKAIRDRLKAAQKQGS